MLLKSVSLSAVGLAALVGCGQGTQPSAVSPAAPAPVTVTVGPTSSVEATTSATTAPTTTTAPAQSSYSANAIRSIAIETTKSLLGERVGPELYQISRNGDYFYVVVHWAARGENGNVQSRDCMVVVDTTGPGDLNERRRSDRCTGKTDDIKIRAAGVYTASVAITPPDGGAPVTGTHTFEVILKGS